MRREKKLVTTSSQVIQDYGYNKVHQSTLHKYWILSQNMCGGLVILFTAFTASVRAYL